MRRSEAPGTTPRRRGERTAVDPFPVRLRFSGRASGELLPVVRPPERGVVTQSPSLPRIQSFFTLSLLPAAVSCRGYHDPRDRHQTLYRMKGGGPCGIAGWPAKGSPIPSNAPNPTDVIAGACAPEEFAVAIPADQSTEPRSRRDCKRRAQEPITKGRSRTTSADVSSKEAKSAQPRAAPASDQGRTCAWVVQRLPA